MQWVMMEQIEQQIGCLAQNHCHILEALLLDLLLLDHWNHPNDIRIHESVSDPWKAIHYK
jgi:hypothetical protein